MYRTPLKEQRTSLGQPQQPLYCYMAPKSVQSANGVEWKERRRLLHPTVRGDPVVTFIGDFVQVTDDLVLRWTTGSASTKRNMALENIYL